MKKFAMLAAAAAVSMVAVPAFAQSANLVKNGDFSNATSKGATSNGNNNFQVTTQTGGTYGTLANWSSTKSADANAANPYGYNIVYNTSNAAQASGNAYGQYTYTNAEYLRYALPAGSSISGNFVALDGAGTFAQALNQSITGLVTGQAYNLSFDWMANQIISRSGAVTDGIQASLGGQTFTTSILSAPSGAQRASFNFVYTGTTASNILSFLSVGSPAGEPPVALLDNVALRAVPEPATWAMMLVGVGMVGASLRQRRRKTALAAA